MRKLEVDMEGKRRPLWQGQFDVLDWLLSPADACEQFCPTLRVEAAPVPPLSIPAGIRRRASTLSKMVLEAAAALCAGQSIDHIILASRHGELQRTLTLLKDAIGGEPLSPTLFSQSVHSTAAGLTTIAFNMEVPVTTVAACRDTFHMAMVECGAYLASQPTHKVLLLAADQRLPELYAPYDDEANVDHVLGLILAKGQQLVGEMFAAPDGMGRAGVVPPCASLTFAGALADGLEQWQVETTLRSWRWKQVC